MNAALSTFFLRELDFVFLIYGLAFFFLGAVSFIIARRNRHQSWSFLAAFGVLHGINEWLDWMALIWPSRVSFQLVRLLFLAGSYLMLLEFGRRTLSRLSGKSFSTVLWIGLLALACSGGAFGADGLNVSIRLAGGLLGGALAALALHRFTTTVMAPQTRQGLRLATVSIALYAFFTGFITPPAPFWPDSIFSEPVFLRTFGIPIQIFRMITASLVAFGLTLFTLRSLYPKPPQKTEGWQILRHWAPYWLTGLALVITLSVGWFAASNSARMANRQLRTLLLDDATYLANALDPLLLKQLNYTPTDVGLPAYRRIRDQLTAWGPCVPEAHWIYLMSRRQGSIVFGPDNVPANAPDYSPPGDLYNDAPPALQHVFDTAQAAVVGPYRDAWGSFHSAFVPVREVRSNTVIAVIGLDVLSDQWDLAILRARLPPLLMTCGIALLIVLGFGIFLHRALIQALKTSFFLEYTESFFAVALGLSITLLAGGQSYQDTFLYQTDKFREWTSIQAKEFQDELGRLVRDSRTLAHFFEGSEWITPGEFDTFVAPLIGDYHALQGYAWVPIAASADRSAIEAQMWRDGATDFRIHPARLSPENSNNRPAQKLLPITRLFPRTGNEALWGLDLTFAPNRLRCIEEALQSGLATASDPISLAQPDRSPDGLILVLPVKIPHSPGPAWAKGWSGVVISFIRIDALLETSRSGFVSPTFPIRTRLVDLTRGIQPYLLADSQRTSGIPHSPEILPSTLPFHATAWRHIVPIMIAGRTWALAVEPDTTLFHPGFFQLPWLVILVGSLVTLLLGAFVLFLQTARNRSEALVALRTRELQASETNFRTIAEGAPFAVTISNFDGDLLFYNPAFVELFELPSREVRNPSLQVNRFYRHPEDRQQLLNSLRSTGRALIEIEANTWTGHPIWSLLSAALIPYNGKPSICVACIDITDRKKAEAELRNQTQLLKTLLDGIPDIVDLQNPDHTVLFYNHAGYASLQLSPTETENKKCFELLGQSQPCDDCAFALAMRSGRMEIVEKYMPHFDAWMKVRAIPVLNKEGKIRLMIEILRDITIAKTASLHQIEANRELESVNRQLEAAIAQTRKLAESANRAKTRFLANISHEIRTPLAGIIGMADLLSDTHLSDSQQGFTEIIRHSGDHLLLLLNDLLDTSKIEAGRIEFENSIFELPQLIHQLGDIIALPAQDKGLELFCRIDPDVPPAVSGDPGRLRQVLMNLLINAVKFTDRGTVSLRVSLAPPNGTRPRIRFEVRDTGPGIPLDMQKSIFEPFVQGDASTTRRYGGTGLGLTISRQLVRLMGGQLELESQEGHGASFIFSLPLAAEQIASPDLSPPPSGLRILLGESHPEVRPWIAELLRGWGNEVVACPDGETVWQNLEFNRPDRRPFDRLILDARLSRAQGQSVVDALLQDPRFQQVPVLLTSCIRDRARLQSSAGAPTVLSRPIQPGSLEQALHSLAGRTPAASKGTQGVAPVLPHWNGKVRILIAEDHPVNLEIASRLLTKLGCLSDQAVNGKLALEALARQPYDLVLMDIQMPEMDGLEATRAIRNPASPVLNHAVPIVVMSAYTFSDEREHLLECGVNDLLVKPVSVANLAAILRKWLPPPAHAALPISK